MKHVVIVNPKAGKHDATDEVRALMEKMDSSVDGELYVTKAPADATNYVRELCMGNPNQKFRFYACGGDGTLNEVVSGAVGCPNAEVTCFPSGSGNDYVKYYGGKERFMNPEALLNGDVKEVDVMRVNDRYSINICNFGFDAIVCRNMERVRRKAVIGGRNAYTTGIVMSLFGGMRTRCRVAVDGEEIWDGNMLLCTMGNGTYCGGTYKSCPRSLNDDGLIEVCLFKPLSIFGFARLLPYYRDGSFIDRPDVQPKMVYRQGQTVDIDAPKPIYLCVDGEVLHDTRFHIEQMPKALRFVVPRQ